jgi:hypothetical protein
MSNAVNGITAHYALKVASIGALGLSSLFFGFVLGQGDVALSVPKITAPQSFIPTQQIDLQPAWLLRSEFDFAFDQTSPREVQDLAFAAPEVRAVTLPIANRSIRKSRRLQRRTLATRIPRKKIFVPVAPATQPAESPVPLSFVAAQLRQDFLGTLALLERRAQTPKTMIAKATPEKIATPELESLPVLLESRPIPLPIEKPQVLAMITRQESDDYSPATVLSSAPEVTTEVPSGESILEEVEEESVPFNKNDFALALASEALSNPTPERLAAIEAIVTSETEDRVGGSEIIPSRLPEESVAQSEAAAQVIDISPVSVARVIAAETPVVDVVKAEPIVASVVRSVAVAPSVVSIPTVSNSVVPGPALPASPAQPLVTGKVASALTAVTPEESSSALARIEEVAADSVVAASVVDNSTPYCGLNTHKFRLSADTDVLDSHPCVAPEWLARSFQGDSGWVRIRPDGLMPTLFAGGVRDEAVLLLDPNSIAMLALKVGNRIVAGTGHVVGVLPEGYKVKVSGRSEEADTFSIHGKRYFSVVNVAPGANVLVMERAGEPAVPMFAPVLQDSVTFLDASHIDLIDVKIHVQKLAASASEIQSLPVKHAMYDSIASLTNSKGTAVLSRVPVVRGYPLYIDVRSKQKDHWGPTYRFEIAAKSGHASVYMPSDEQVQSWISQGAEFRSDSGWVLGAVSQDRLDGYRRYSFAKVQPLERETPIDPTTFSIGRDGKLALAVPLEGDSPRFIGTRVPGGLAISSIIREDGILLQSRLLPISPLVIHVVAPPTF